MLQLITYENSQASNTKCVYHRCLCFISCRTTMVEEKSFQETGEVSEVDMTEPTLKDVEFRTTIEDEAVHRLLSLTLFTHFFKDI